MSAFHTHSTPIPHNHPLGTWGMGIMMASFGAAIAARMHIWGGEGQVGGGHITIMYKIGMGTPSPIE